MSKNLLSRALHRRAARALERQLDYQRKKSALIAGSEDEIIRSNFVRSQKIRRRLEAVRPMQTGEPVLEVGSGAHGLIFGFSDGSAIGMDPLAAHYKSLFPKLQGLATTVAALGEQLPFEDGSFGVVLSDNVIDHAEKPFGIIDEIVRVLKPGGILYFTVNVHHPLYDMASRLYGAGTALGVNFELSAFADHTVHLTEAKIARAWSRQPVNVVEQHSTVSETRNEQRRRAARDPDSLLKKAFFKNAVFELIAVRR